MPGVEGRNDARRCATAIDRRWQDAGVAGLYTAMGTAILYLSASADTGDELSCSFGAIDTVASKSGVDHWKCLQSRGEYE